MIDRVVLITGGSGGIGGAIVDQFAKEGATVCLQYSSNLEAATSLKDSRDNIHLFKQNFFDRDITLIKDVVDRFGKIDYLINCAGVLGNCSIFDMKSEDFDNIFTINSKIPYILSAEAFKYMKRDRYGRIINISSIAVKYGMGRDSAIQYAGSKAALEALTTGLSKLGAEHNILVNTIRPGVILTDMQKNRDNLDKRLEMIPLKRAGTPKEIADMVIFLTSHRGDFITGETITIGGGE